MKVRNKNAYLLFYDRVKYFGEDGTISDKILAEKDLKNVSKDSSVSLDIK